MNPGIAVHFDPICFNIHCEGVIGLRDFKLGENIEKSYGFTFVGPVSMEMPLTINPAVFVKITTYVTSHTVQIFSKASYFFLGPTHG